MKSHTRRAVALISATIINKQTYSLIQNIENYEFHKLSCNILPTMIDAYDDEMKCFIKGNIKEDKISIYHFGNANYIDLKINNNHFEGFDYDSVTDFTGDLNDDQISLNDHEYQKVFEYLVK
ncbi:MAG TPA: hypothetical protein VKA26_08920 [Ignavibacteriaceae bacterium]|nr:hypothetical protein [Ignavibacteriaceae bacterium]